MLGITKKLIGTVLVCVLAGFLHTSIYAGNVGGFGNDGAVKATRDINIGSTEELQREDALLDVIQGAVNWVLGVLALIALILLMYGGMRMVTAGGNEETYKQGFKVLKAAAIGLLMIGVAWFIVSIGLRLTQQVGFEAEGSNAGTQN